LDQLADALIAVDFSTAVAGVVHGDWGEAQLLYRHGEVSGVLDLEFVHPDLLIVDLARVTSSPDIGASAHFVRGYETERDLSDAEVFLIGLAQQARHLQNVWPAIHGLLHDNGTARCSTYGTVALSSEAAALAGSPSSPQRRHDLEHRSTN
jgi:Ser/Thr protein kinase RdoA (MazF antagonist)